MHCENCGKYISHKGARFCRHCGHPLTDSDGFAQVQPPGNPSAQREAAATYAATYGQAMHEQAVSTTASQLNKWRLMTVISLAVLAGGAVGVAAWAGDWFGTSTHNGQALAVSANKTGLTDVSGGKPNSLTVQQIISNTLPSLAYVDVNTDNSESIGSGFVLDSQGDIVTNAHVVAGAQSIQVKLQNGSAHTGQVIGIDSNEDIAEIRVAAFAHHHALQLASVPAQLGDSVIAMGSPLGLKDTVTSGMISGLHRNFTIGGTKYQDMYQISAPIAPGNSGGPLVSGTTGQVLGIDTAGVTQGSGNIAFAIPINAVAPQLNSWAQHPMDQNSIQAQLARATQMESGSAGSASTGNGSNGSGVGGSGSDGSGGNVGGGTGSADTGGLQSQSFDLVTSYYNYVNQQDYLDAYALLGQDLQTKIPFKKFVNGYSNTVQDSLGNAVFTPMNSASGKVDFTLQAQEVQADGNSQLSIYHIVDTCAYEDGQLRIVHSTMTLVSRQ